jgi:RecB family exonuclease
MILGEIMYINKISNSKREIFRQCGLRYKRRYIDYYEGDSPKNGDSLNFGQYIHKIFEEGTKAGHIKDLEKLAEHHRPTYKISANYNKRIEHCLNNFLRFNSKLTETLATEFEYEISISEDIKVNGVIDRIVKGSKGGYLVIDYKTSKKEKTRFDLFSDSQLLLSLIHI